MKNFTIFLIILFFVAAIFFQPERVTVGSAVTEKLIEHLYVFEDTGNTAKQNFDILKEIKTELEYLQISYKSIPDTFSNSGTLQGIFTVLETLATTIMDVLSIPLIFLGAAIVFIVDAIVLIFNLLSLLNIFTISI